MSEINRPNIEEILFYNLLKDQNDYLGTHSSKLNCPVCGRPCALEEMSKEHIIPRSVIALDDRLLKDEMVKTDRSQLTLLCKKPLGKHSRQRGCNGYKGTHYDPVTKEFFSLFQKDEKKAQFRNYEKVSDELVSNFRLKLTPKEQARAFELFAMKWQAFNALAYLAVFKLYGYKFAYSKIGQLYRNLFLRPLHKSNIFPFEKLSKNLPTMISDNKLVRIRGLQDVYGKWRKTRKTPFYVALQYNKDQTLCSYTILLIRNQELFLPFQLTRASLEQIPPPLQSHDDLELLEPNPVQAKIEQTRFIFPISSFT